MSTPDTTYNYSTFRPGPYIEGSCDGPSPGDFLGDFAVFDVEARLWRVGDLVDGVTVIETGSTTCPLYCAQIEPMRRVSSRHGDVRFVMLYTREAHPGERRGPHLSTDDKLEEAARIADSAGEWREVWIDRLEGDLHQRLAGSPNSVTILDSEARVLAWLHDSDAGAVEQLLDGLSRGDVPSDVRSKFRPPSPRAIAALLRGGWKAVWDFALGFPSLAAYRLSGGPDC